MSENLSYYSRFREERKAYQRDYYKRNRMKIRRQKELDATLNPDKIKRIRDYQREYYKKNKEQLLRKKREKYYRKKGEINAAKLTDGADNNAS